MQWHLFQKTPKDAWAYLEENVEYAKMWVDTNEHDRNESTPTKGEMIHLKPEEDMQARVTTEVARQMKSLQLGKNNEANVFCVLAENEEHDTSHCPEVPVVKDMIKEHNMAMVNWVSNQGKCMNFNNLNPSWKTNENTRWGAPQPPQQQMHQSASSFMPPSQQGGMQSHHEFMQ